MNMICLNRDLRVVIDSKLSMSYILAQLLMLLPAAPDKDGFAAFLSSILYCCNSLLFSTDEVN